MWYTPAIPDKSAIVNSELTMGVMKTKYKQ